MARKLAELRAARDHFEALLKRENTMERDWQQLFASHPLILSEALPLRLRASQIVSQARPGKSEADFLIYPEQLADVPPTYGVIELKRPMTTILSVPRRHILTLSRDAATALAQAKVYAEQLKSELYNVPGNLIAIGSGAHIFLIVGSSSELRSKITNDVERRQFEELLPGGCRLLPFDTLFRLFERRVPPHIHIAVALPRDDAYNTKLSVLGATPIVISHCAQERAFVEYLAAALRAYGLHVWHAGTCDEPDGDTLAAAVAAIAAAPAVVIVLSSAVSWRQSISWDFAQIERRQSILGRDFLVGVALDDSWNRGQMAIFMRRYPVLNFSGWQEASKLNQRVLALIDVLKAAAAA